MGRFIEVFYGAFVSKAFLKAEGFTEAHFSEFTSLSKKMLQRFGFQSEDGVLVDDEGQVKGLKIAEAEGLADEELKEKGVKPSDMYFVYVDVTASRISEIPPESDDEEDIMNEMLEIDARKRFKRYLDRRIRRNCMLKGIYRVFN